MKNETAIIIPARYESTRFPGKSLAMISGKPMVEWVVKAALGSKYADKIIVATEDERILNFVNKNLSNIGSKPIIVQAKMTSKNHESGTDRIAEVVKNDPDIKYIVNLQGDEPLMPSSYLDKVIELIKDDKTEMSSLITPIENENELNNPNIVKTVLDKDGYALYFSRSMIPYLREQNFSRNLKLFYRHLGIYAYTRNTILQFSLLPQSELEKAEKLEQLRALENGIKIKLAVVPKATQAVDTPSDIIEVEKHAL